VPDCISCPAIIEEKRWSRRLLVWLGLRWRCGISGRYVAPGDTCAASLHDLRRMERFCTEARAARGEIDQHTLYTVEGGLGSGRRIYMAHDDRDQGGGCQWRIVQDEQTEG
jgi:hypothetical protein